MSTGGVLAGAVTYFEPTFNTSKDAIALVIERLREFLAGVGVPSLRVRFGVVHESVGGFYVSFAIVHIYVIIVFTLCVIEESRGFH